MEVEKIPGASPERLDRAVGNRVKRLQGEFLTQELPRARGDLAHLRQAVDEVPGTSPLVWQLVLEALPEQFVGTRDEPTAGEWAAHLALTLYAVHQRGNQNPMHQIDNSLGRAAGRLVRTRQAQSQSVKKRYDAVLTATNFTSRRYHLRSLVGLLSTEAIPVDYGRLALDLYRFQKPGGKDSVNREWGRDFYRAFTYQPVDESSDTASNS